MKSKEWKNRLRERSDITTTLVHLTRGKDGKDALDILFKIINDLEIKGSTTDSGFIIGNRSAVCFQDAPLLGVIQNAYYEQKMRKSNKNYKIRYKLCGLMFQKNYVYNKGGRPVIYDKTEEAKKYITKLNYWRIVNYDLSNSNNIIDWTHEKEWRVPDSFEFDLSKATILVPNEGIYSRLVKEYKKKYGRSIIDDCDGIVNVGRLFI